MEGYLPAIVHETAPNPEFAVIWLHGLGADGSDFAPIIPELRLPPALRIRFIFPHAPEIPITCNGGYIMRAWYDIRNIDGINRNVDETGIMTSRTQIQRLIFRENGRGIPCSHIVLAGFSQGGAIAYTTALTHTETLAGLIALSAYLPAPEQLFRNATPAGRMLPVLAAHGTEDPVVPLSLGEAARDALQQRGYHIVWHSYPMPHAVCTEEINTIGNWLIERFSKAV